MCGHSQKWARPFTSGNYKSGVSYKWFDELSRLIEWFLHTDSDEKIFNLTANLLSTWHLNARGSKTKSNFHNVRVGVLKNGRGYSPHEIVKLAVSQECVTKEFWLER